MRVLGKVVLAVALAYLGLMVASFIGGFLAGALGVTLHLAPKTVSLFEWTFPKVIFVGTLIWLYVVEKRKKGHKSPATQSRRASA